MKAKGNSKPTVSLEVRNVRLLCNYIIPFFNSMPFISTPPGSLRDPRGSPKGKKRHDFSDFVLICIVLYVGGHRDVKIINLILKLSSGMNDFRLFTYEGGSPSNNALTSHELTTLKELVAFSQNLSIDQDLKVDVDLMDDNNSLGANFKNNVVYMIIKPDMTELIVGSLKEAANIVGINSDALSKLLKSLPVNSNGVEVNKNLVRRVKVFCGR